MKISKRIRNIRVSKKLTQSDVASKLDISSSAYGQIERNADKATITTIQKVANALDVTINSILNED